MIRGHGGDGGQTHFDGRLGSADFVSDVFSEPFRGLDHANHAIEKVIRVALELLRSNVARQASTLNSKPS